MTTAAVVLSAGESSRMGGRPKALLPVGGTTGIRRIVGLCAERGFDPICAVLGAHREEISKELEGLNIQVVDSPRWSEGRTASIQSGWEAIPDDRDVLLWPIDHPLVEGDVVDRLRVEGARDALAVWIVPTFEGRGGHPVLLRASLRPAVMALAANAPLRSLQGAYGPQVLRVPVDDPGVVANIDTPEAYRQALTQWEARRGGSQWTDA